MFSSPRRHSNDNQKYTTRKPPKNWAVRISTTNDKGRPYYVNLITNETQWEFPQLYADSKFVNTLDGEVEIPENALLALKELSRQINTLTTYNKETVPTFNLSSSYLMKLISIAHASLDNGVLQRLNEYSPVNDIASVLLYCHGKKFDINPEILYILNLSYTLIDKKEPEKIDSINITEGTEPTIFSTDRNLPAKFWGLFNVVVDYNCDYTGWGTSAQNFEIYTVPLYTNMVRALNPEAWCLITSFEDVDFKRVKDQERKRLDLIKELLTNNLGNFLIIKEKIYTIFYGGSSFGVIPD